ncbi:MAG: GC-type dockerin domain-anchored protein [Planctomycetota bacterium]
MRHSPAIAFALAAGLASAAAAQVVNIPPDSLPAESWFAANPGATVNVLSGGSMFPDAGGGAFTFNGATVNIEAGGGAGFPTIDHFVEDVTYNLDGGELVRVKFVGGTGTTTLNIIDGQTRRGVWLQGNTTCTMSGGDAGLVAGGQAAIIIEDDASFTMTGGTIDTFILAIDDATVSIIDGTIEGALQLDDRATATISGGSVGRNGFMKTIDNRLTITGGTIGRDFVVEKGVVDMSGGAMDRNCAILNGGGGVDPIFNMTGGALGSEFRAYDGTINVSGGLIGDAFRLGRPTGDGSGVTMNLLVKSATLDGVALDLTETPATIATRGGAFLSCILLDDSLVGFHLNEDLVFGEDRFRAAATLTIALGTTACTPDLDGDGELTIFDFLEFQSLFATGDLAADLDGDGVLTIFDFLAFQSAFALGC